jgi:RHS repeat-associated protein
LSQMVKPEVLEHRGDRGWHELLRARRSHRATRLCHQRQRCQGLDDELRPLRYAHRLDRQPLAARFPGQWLQAESGLHQNWMRDYDPTTGRYIQPDPLGLVDGASVYGYAWQKPGRWIEPTGENPLVAVWGAFEGCMATPACAAGVAAIVAGGIVAQETLPDEGEQCSSCPPCTPYPAGTIGYRLDRGHTHFPAGDPHLNLYTVNQAPNCKCRWNAGSTVGKAVDPPPMLGWVDISPYRPGLPPLSP